MNFGGNYRIFPEMTGSVQRNRKLSVQPDGNIRLCLTSCGKIRIHHNLTFICITEYKRKYPSNKNTYVSPLYVSTSFVLKLIYDTEPFFHKLMTHKSLNFYYKKGKQIIKNKKESVHIFNVVQFYSYVICKTRLCITFDKK